MSLFFAAVIAVILFHLTYRFWEKFEFSHALMVLGLITVMLFILISSLAGRFLPQRWDRVGTGLAIIVLFSYIFRLMVRSGKD